MGGDPTTAELEWIAAAWQFPDDLRELGLPLNGVIGAATRRALEAIQREGARPGVLRDVLSLDSIGKAMGIQARPYREMMESAPVGGRQFKVERVLTVSDIFAPLAPVNWLCQALDLARGAPALIAGYGFSGKTVAVQDFALATASGTKAWGHFPVRPGRVLHLDYEQGEYLTRLRYQRLAAARGIDPASIVGRLEVHPLPSWYLDGEVEAFIEHVAGGFDLGIIDSFRAACPGTEENSSDARVPLDRLTRVSERTGIVWVVLHHARKPSQEPRKQGGGARMAIRGSGALYDACGSVLVFSSEKGEPVTVEHEKARITGRTHDPFQLWIEDVATDDGPEAGLRVSARESPTSTDLAPAEALRETKARVLAYVRERGGTSGGVNVLVEEMGGKRNTIAAAVAELLREERLLRGGTARVPTLSMPGTT